MSELNISHLPTEVLTKVFRFLDVPNLKNATLTCKVWKSLIESKCRWSLNLNYDKHGQFESKHPNSAEEKMHFILKTNRKFGQVDIVGLYFRLGEENHHVYQIFERHGFNVVKLTLGNCRCNLVSIAQLLSLTPNLTHAELYEVYLRNASDELPDQVLPSLKKLKNLEIGKSAQRIIECFRKAKLTTMEIRLPFHDGGGYGQRHSRSEICNSLVNFLPSQDMLTSLAVDEIASLILIQLVKLKVPIPFRLTRLESSMEYGASSHDHDNFLRFVQKQAESLTEMKLGHHIPNSVYDYVFASMTKLNTLIVYTDMYGIPKNSDFYKQLKGNSNIRTVKLLIEAGQWFDDRCVVDFLRKLTNIRHLILPFHTEKNVLAEAAQNLNQLESLTLRHFDKHSIKSVTLPRLKTLHIHLLRGKINWDEFTQAHPLLTELTIESMDKKSCLTSDDIDQISANVDLHTMRLGVGFVADDRFFEIVRSNCTDLKVLDLHESCLPRGLNDNVGISMLRLCSWERFFWTLWYEF